MDKDFLRLIENVDELITQQEARLDDDCLICECFCVSARDIRETCESEVDFELLENRFGMGTGCQTCIKNKNSWIDKIF